MCSLAEKRLLVKVITYLRSKTQSSELQEDQKESLEVALQCLESTFNVNLSDPALQSNIDLVQLFTNETNSNVPTEVDKANADMLKNDGNDLMKEGKFDEAVAKYSGAINLHASPIYFCNRAAAYSKLERHQDAVEDCKIALQMDPSYGKAFGRMGLAYSCISKFAEARDAYKKAVELEPSNESFQNNLRVAEEKLRETSANVAQGFPGFGAPPGAGGAVNMFELLNNPMISQMAQQMMSDPSMQNMISGMMGGLYGGGAPPTAAPGAGPQADGPNAVPPVAAGMNINNLLEMGQRFAGMMQQQNPDLVEQLRRQFQSESEGGAGTGDQQDPSQPRPPPNNP